VPITFDFGNTPEGEAFFERFPKFYPAFERLIQLTNKSFGPRHVSSSLEATCVSLGFTCCVDLSEIVFLGVNGHSIGATKILRGLYERAVTLAYLLKDPEKVDRFVAYGAIIEHKLIQEARKHTPDEEIERHLGTDSIAKIEERYSEYKHLFLRAGGKKLAPSWDIPFASQVENVGSPFTDYYLAAYLLPTQHTHATLTSINPPKNPAIRRHHSDFNVLMSEALLLKVVELHNQKFPTVSEQELEAGNQDFQIVWVDFLHIPPRPKDSQ
jgi:hypothetical protein